MSEMVPEGWLNLSVAEVFEIGRGRVISKDEIRDNTGNYPVYSSQSFNNGEMGRINSFDFEGEYVTWTTDGAYAGTVFYRNGKFSCTNVCGTLRDSGKYGVDMKFVAEYLSTVAKQHVSYVGNPKLMNGIFGEINLLIPPLPEQKKIASILTSVDEVIEKTQSQIDKLQDLKKGTMNELLTKGIGHTESKDSELGRIPKSWFFKRLDSVVTEFIVPMRDKPKVFSGTIPWIRIEDFVGKYLYSSKSNQCVDESIINKMRLKVYPEGTVLCSCSARLGVCTITARKMVSNQTFIGLVPGEGIDKEYLYYMMESHANNLQKLSSGTTIDYLPREKFEEFSILVPPMVEQMKIVSILSSMDTSIKKKEYKLSQIQSLKKSLMQDLLTGKVRVTVN